MARTRADTRSDAHDPRRLLSGAEVLERIYPPERRPKSTDVLMKLVRKGIKSATGRQVRLKCVVGPYGRLYRLGDVDAFLQELTTAWEKRHGLQPGVVAITSPRRKDRVIRQVAQRRSDAPSLIRCAPHEKGTYPPLDWRGTEGEGRKLDLLG